MHRGGAWRRERRGHGRPTVAPRRAFRAGVLVVVAALGSGGIARFPDAAAQTELNAEARVYFERGNEHFSRAMRASGDRRSELLERALESYLESLRVVRSRNALFNTAVTLEKLGRNQEAFAYWTEYLNIPGLSGKEKEEGRRRRDALRDDVAVVAVNSEPAGAAVHVDRLDLAPHGTTPVQIALEPGKHIIYMTLEGYARSQVQVEAERGEKVRAHAELEHENVALHVASSMSGTLLVDGERAELGSPVQVRPGRHTVRLERDGGPAVEREVDVEPGSGSVTVQLEPDRGPAGTLVVQSDPAATVAVDGAVVGRGAAVRTRLAPGSHEVRVEAPDRAAYERRIQVSEGQRTTLRVSLAPSVEGKRRLGNAPLWTGIATGAAAATAAGVGLWAIKLKSDYDDFAEGCEGDPMCVSKGQTKADRLDRANLATDVMIGLSAALGLSTLVLGLVNGEMEQPPSSATVAAVPLHGGAAVHAELPWDTM